MDKSTKEIEFFSKVVKDILEGYYVLGDCGIDYTVEKITDWAIDWADIHVK